MSPEMISEKPNGTKTDVWSLGITMAFLTGLDKACPNNYQGGVPQFIVHCIQSKFDAMLGRKNIFISPIFKDLLQKMLVVDPEHRISMHEVLSHKFIAED